MNTPGSRDSPVMNTPGSHDSPVMNTPGSRDSPVMNTPGSRDSPRSLPRCLYQLPGLVMNTQGSLWCYQGVVFFYLVLWKPKTCSKILSIGKKRLVVKKTPRPKLLHGQFRYFSLHFLSSGSFIKINQKYFWHCLVL